MKIPAKIGILLLMLFNVVMVFAETPPQPPSTAKVQAVNATPPPPELPIDGELLLTLLAAGLLFGLYTIYRYKLKKASV